MKRIALISILFIFATASCIKTESLITDSSAKKENADLIRDWINVQLQVIKNTTGVQHVAYSPAILHTPALPCMNHW